MTKSFPLVLTYLVIWFRYFAIPENVTFLRRHSVTIDPVQYWGVHPYERMAFDKSFNARDLQTTTVAYRNMIISIQNNAIYAYANANPSKAAVISYITSIVLPKSSSFWSSALRVYPTKSYSVTNPVCFYNCIFFIHLRFGITRV